MCLPSSIERNALSHYMNFWLLLRTSGLKFFLLSYLIAMFLVTSAWRGNLLALLTVTKFPERIHTFEGLQSQEPYNVSFYQKFLKALSFSFLKFSSLGATFGILLCKSWIFGDRVWHPNCERNWKEDFLSWKLHMGCARSWSQPPDHDWWNKLLRIPC